MNNESTQNKKMNFKAILILCLMAPLIPFFLLMGGICLLFDLFRGILLGLRVKQ